MQAIILAGGFGTRLQSVVSNVPKPMAPINGKPFLEYLLDELEKQGVNKVVLAVGYKKECIINYFGNSHGNLEIVYSTEDEPLGTGGCVRKAFQYIDEDFAFILNGDTMFKIDFHEMAKLKTISIACKKMHSFERYGEVKLNGEFVTSFEEKKYVNEGYINGGIYYLPKNIFKNYKFQDKFSLEKDFFEKYINKLNIRAFLSSDYFIDIGIPEDYSKAQIDFKKKRALFLDRDGVINIDYGHVYKVTDFKFTNFIFDLCKKYQKEGYVIIVITNQSGIGKGLYSESDFIKLNDYMIQEFKKRDIVISKVYFCPHKPEDKCKCRKPKPGMFFQAIKDFDIDPNQSIMVGDKMSDLIAANAAGVNKKIFVNGNYAKENVDFEYSEI